MDRFDVVVVGARCAGSPLAVMLAQRGLRVCLLDRAHFPSDTPSTHVIQPCGVAVLEQIGVLEDVLAAGAVRIEQFQLDYDDVRIRATVASDTYTVASARVGGAGLCLRRVGLDAVLVQAAARCGVDVRTATAVEGLLDEDGRVVGVRTADGTIEASVVVGADGRRSSVARMVGAREYHVAPAGRMPAWAYFENVPDPGNLLRLARIGDLAYLAAPTDSGLYMAGVAVSHDDRGELLADRDRNFLAALQRWPEVADLLAGARRVGPIRAVPQWHGYFRTGAGAGWVLIGDAGHFKDPTPAQGISDALRQAAQLAPALEAGLGGSACLDDELQRWWRWRDADCYDMYWFASDIGAPGPCSPLITSVMAVISEDDIATRALMQVLNRDRRPAQLLSTRRLLRAAVRAARRHPRGIAALAGEIATTLREEVRRARGRNSAGTPRDAQRSDPRHRASVHAPLVP